MRQFFPRFFASYGSGAAANTPAATHSGGRFAKFSKDRDLRQAFPLSSLENEAEAENAGYGQKKDAGIVVTKGFTLDPSKSTNTSTEDLVATSSRKYSPA